MMEQQIRSFRKKSVNLSSSNAPTLHRRPTLNVMALSKGFRACIADVFTSIKTGGQFQGPQHAGSPCYRGLFGSMATLVRQGGLRGVYAGLVPGLKRQFAISTLRIGFYEQVKKFYAANTENLLQCSPSVEAVFLQSFPGTDEFTVPGDSMAVKLLSGITTGGFAIIIAQPLDAEPTSSTTVNKTGPKRHANCVDTYRKMYRGKGFRGHLKGLKPSGGSTAVVNACELVAYDVIKDQILHRGLKEDTVSCHMVAAGGAGVLTTLVASPIDAVNTQYTNSRTKYQDLWDCFKRVARDGGLRTLYVGVVPSLMRMASWNICTFMVSEQFKRGITHISEQSKNSSLDSDAADTEP